MKCHVCLDDLKPEEEYYEICGNCSEDCKKSNVIIVICNRHNVPQAIFPASKKYKGDRYKFSDYCRLNNEDKDMFTE